MSILTRDEFIALVDEYGRTVLLQDVEGEGRRVAEAYDAALARIAELESPAHRARIAREFMDAVDAEWFSDGTGSMDEIRDAVLARWEAAAKEGE